MVKTSTRKNRYLPHKKSTKKSKARVSGRGGNNPGNKLRSF